MKSKQLVEGFLHDDEEDWNEQQTIYILLILLALLLSVCSSKIVYNPQVVAILIGLFMGIITSFTPYRDFMVDLQFEPVLLLQLYYPIVLLKFCYSIDVLMFSKSLPEIVCIVILKAVAGVGLRIIVYYHTDILGNNSTSEFVFYAIYRGMMYTFNDVPEIRLKSERMKYLETLLIGDGIIGSALTIAVVESLKIVTVDHLTVYQCMAVIFRLIGVGTLIGFILVAPCARVFRYFYNDSKNAATYIIFLTYGCFFICENFIGVSGMFCCMIIVFGFNRSRVYLSDETDRYLQLMFNIFYCNISTIIYFVISFVMFIHSIPFHLKPIGRGIAELVMITFIKVLVLLIMYPIMKRSRYGYDLNIMFALIWGGKWGPAQLYGPLMLSKITAITTLTKQMYFRRKSYVLLVIINILQVSTFGPILKKLGFLDMSVTRKDNIKQCAMQIDKQRFHHLSVIKMDRAYNEANWTLIYQLTDIRRLTETQIDDNVNFNLFSKVIACNKCTNSVSFEPDAVELNELIREVHVRILKALKVSFVRQYEQGFLDNVEIKMLVQAVENSMHTEEFSLESQDLSKFRKLAHRGRYEKCKFLCFDMNQRSIPKDSFRRWCYKIVIKEYFERFYLLMNVLCVLVALVQVCFRHRNIEEQIASIVLDTFFQLIFACEILVKILSCSDKSICQGFINYICVGSNMISFILFIISCCDFVMYITYAFPGIMAIYTIGLYIQIARVTRLLRLLIIIIFFSSQLELILTRNSQQKACHSFAVALAMIRGFDEILDHLPNLTENIKLLQIARTKINNDKLQLIQDFGLAEVATPHTSVRVKTKQSIKISLKAIASAINDLKLSGVIDEYEHVKLVKSLEERLQKYAGIKSGIVVPKNILYEMPWLQQDPSLFNYIYANVDTRIWKPGDTIVRVGETIQGIFIIVTGMFKISYVPSTHMIEKMRKRGLLPIKDYIRNTRYFENEESYVMVGNSIGELCMMTKRPYNAKITAFAPSQAFVVPGEVLERAINMNRDPINGPEARMWRLVLTNIIKSILRLNPMYQSIGFDEMNNMLDRAFVPNLQCYKVFVITEYIQDVLLVEGLATDYNTGHIYIAPCYIPRMTQKITMGETGGKTILVIIPLPDIDEYEVMNYTELQSELISHHDSDCMLHVKHYHQERRDKIQRNNCRLRVKSSQSPSISLQFSGTSKMLSKFETVSSDPSGITIISQRSK